MKREKDVSPDKVA